MSWNSMNAGRTERIVKELEGDTYLPVEIKKSIIGIFKLFPRNGNVLVETTGHVDTVAGGSAKIEIKSVVVYHDIKE